MKFECDSCHAQYMIADEKVGKRGVKVKCKRCAHVIIVRPGGVAASKKDDVPEDSPETTEPARGGGRAEKPFQDEAVPTRAQNASDDLLVAAGRLHLDDGANPADHPSIEAPAAHSDDAEATVARPAPISLAVPPSSPQDTTQVAKPPEMSFEPRAVGRSTDDDQTELGGPPQRSTSGVFGDEPARPAAPAMAAAPAGDLGGDAGALLDDQIAGAFNSMFDTASAGMGDVTFGQGGGASGEGDQRGPTKVLDVDSMNLLRKAAQPAPSSSGPAEDGGLDSLRAALGGEESGLHPWKDGAKNGAMNGADDGPAAPEWHVAIDEEDVGPLELAEIGRHIEAGRVDRDSLVWKTGMDDWVPASEVGAIRALFDRVPMPKIGSLMADDEPAPSSSPNRRPHGGGYGGLDVGSPIDDLPPSPMSAPPGDDPFSGPGDSTDPSWRPHGLTDVYQAANLAEMAASGAAPPGYGPPQGSSKGASASAAAASNEPEWRPGAASALSALVNDEMQRIGSGPPPASDDDLSMPPAADDGSLSTPFSSLAGGDLDAGPELGGSSALGRGEMGARTSSKAGQQQAYRSDMVAPSYPPQPMPFAPAKSERPAWFMPAIIGGSLLVLLMFVLVATLVFAVTKTPPPAQMAAAPVAPVPVPVAPVAVAAPVVPVAAPVAATPASPPGAGEASPPKVDDAAAGAAASEPSEKVAVAAKEPAPKKEPKATAGATSTKKKEEPPPPPKPMGKPGCDPILDLGCKADGKGGTSAPQQGLSKNDVLVVIMKSKGSVEACGAKHGVNGVVKMKWEIDKSGKTREVQVADSQFAGTPVGGCLVTAIKGWKFPAYAGDPVPPVTFPFKLKG